MFVTIWKIHVHIILQYLECFARCCTVNVDVRIGNLKTMSMCVNNSQHHILYISEHFNPRDKIIYVYCIYLYS